MNHLNEYFNSEYISWKLWSADKFGNLQKGKSRYFDTQISQSRMRFDAGSKVLEIGFGHGHFLSYARQNCWDVTGAELNNDLVHMAIRHGFNAMGSNEIFGIANETYDLIVAFDVLEHISQRSVVNFMMNIKRILKNGGYFIATFPNGDSPFGLPNQNGDITHLNCIGSGMAKFLGKAVGFEICYIGGERQSIFGVSIQHFAHKILTIPIKKAINCIVNLIFYPRVNIDFCSSNLLVIYKVVKE